LSQNRYCLGVVRYAGLSVFFEICKMINISTYQDNFQQEVIKLILNIQQNEFGVPITIEDQPDLLIIPSFYQQNHGNFWVALANNEVVGTIALIDIGDSMGALRKMFVKADFRGKEHGVAAMLLETLLNHCRYVEMKSIYLGTNAILKAAHRFYDKNGFVRLPKEDLPPQFPLMAVDTIFYEYQVK
jgi:putative acetyltransferase